MELELIRKIDIASNADVQYHRLMLLESGTVIAFYSDDKEECYYLDWYATAGVEHTRIADFTYDVFDPPTLFQFSGFVGLYATSGNMLHLFTEEEKTQPIRISIFSTLPCIQYPGFEKELINYVYAGSTDSDTVPFLLKDSGLLPVYFAELKIDVADRSAVWLSLNHWNNRYELSDGPEVLKKPSQKPLTLLHALRKNEQTYIFSIGDRDGGYLKYGMDYSDLCLLNIEGKVKEKLFSLGALNKGAKKGGKECLFTSSGYYAMLTPVFHSDDWKGQQKLLDIDRSELIDVGLPKGLSDFKIIDHNAGCFLLIDGMRNQIITGMSGILICASKA
jgi:hypothetical protein